MEIDAAPLKVKQGNPIELSLTISGSGNLPSISEPAFSGDASVWKLYGSKRADSRDLQRDPRNPLLPLSNEGSVTFTRMVVPIEVASEIPSFEFSFFDPDSAEYRTLRTDRSHSRSERETGGDTDRPRPGLPHGQTRDLQQDAPGRRHAGHPLDPRSR